VNIEHLLDHPRVTFIEGSITDLDLLMETRRARGPEREHRRCDPRSSRAGSGRWSGWQAEKAGEERRVSTISAGAGGVVGGVVAVIVRVLGGG